ncbi:MAG: hypothetical protein Q8R02_19880 [Hyphomonadaceae bacterium]|nr:hypothetical protein [Hyphomonadaceae bacterium]
MSEADSPAPGRADIEAAAELILASRGFAASPRLQALLRYVIGATLDGQAERLKEFSIAVDVFARPPAFDPRFDSIVRTQASRLRKQIAEYYRKEGAADPIRIEIPPGGYVAIFSRVDAAAISSAKAAMDPAAAPVVLARAPEAPVAGKPQRQSLAPRTLIMAGMLVAATLALVAIVSVVVASRTGVASDLATVSPSGPTVFVASYQLIDGPGHGRQLRDGLQFELIDRLHQFPELSILGIDTVYGADAEAASADPKGADFILGGAVQSSGTNLKVTSQLVRTSDNTVVWSQVFDSPLADASGVLALQSEIAGDVAAQLGQPYGVIQEKLKVELTEARRLSLEDYLCVLDAYDYSRAKSEASHLRVRTCLEQVTQRSPNYSPAWAKLSWMYGDEERMAFNRRLNERPPFERAREAAGRAVVADAGSATAHQYLAIALFHLGDDEAFRAEIEKALVLNPNNSEILADAGLTLTLLDVSERAREVSEKAILLNPGHPAWYYAAPAAYHLLRGEKEAAMQNALRYAPESSPASAYLLAAAYRLNGEAAKADETLEELGRRTPSAISDRNALLKSLRFPPKLAGLIFG